MGRNFLAKTDSRQITRGFLEDEDRVSLGLPTSSVFLCMCAVRGRFGFGFPGLLEESRNVCAIKIPSKKMSPVQGICLLNKSCAPKALWGFVSLTVCASWLNLGTWNCGSLASHGLSDPTEHIFPQVWQYIFIFLLVNAISEQKKKSDSTLKCLKETARDILELINPYILCV